MHYHGDYGFDEFLRHGIGRQATAANRDRAHGWACTGFAALSPAGDTVFGRNFDWHNRQTLLLFTDPPDGYASVSMVDISYLGFPAGRPSWADRRRLLDAPYLPFDGMNERGLAVGMMAVSHAQDSSSPERVTISSLHAIRLMLDHAAGVDQAIALLRNYTVDFGDGPPIHYLIADTSGRAAVIEYIAGEMIVSPNEQGWQVSTNFIVAQEQPEGNGSTCWRYNRAYETLEHAGGALSQREAMDLLREVSQGNTVWSVVYNGTSGDVSIAMGRHYDRVHDVNLRMTLHEP